MADKKEGLGFMHAVIEARFDSADITKTPSSRLKLIGVFRSADSAYLYIGEEGNLTPSESSLEVYYFSSLIDWEDSSIIKCLKDHMFVVRISTGDLSENPLFRDLYDTAKRSVNIKRSSLCKEEFYTDIRESSEGVFGVQFNLKASDIPKDKINMLLSGDAFISIEAELSYCGQAEVERIGFSIVSQLVESDTDFNKRLNKALVSEIVDISAARRRQYLKYIELKSKFEKNDQH